MSPTSYQTAPPRTLSITLLSDRTARLLSLPMKMLLRAGGIAAAMSIAAAGCGGTGSEQGTPQDDAAQPETAGPSATPGASPTAASEPSQPESQAPPPVPASPTAAPPPTAAPTPSPPTPTSAASPPSPSPTVVPDPAPSEEAATPAPQQPAPTAALAVLDGLAVEPEHDGGGYERGHFDHNRHHLCDTSGSDPYTGVPFTPGTCDVDHIVAAKEAYESGAWSWDVARRQQFGNTAANLMASRDCVNRSKGANDIAEWSGTVGSGVCEGVRTTPQGRCFLARKTVQVKEEWSLSVDPLELAALRSALSGCGDGSPASPSSPVSEPADRPAPEPSQTSSATESGDCHPAYSPCLPHLAGDALNCGDLSSDQRPVTVLVPGSDPYRLDRDGDGRGCV